MVRHIGDPKPLSRDTVQLWITKSREYGERFGYGTGAAVEAATGELIGRGAVARREGSGEVLVYGLSQVDRASAAPPSTHAG